MAFRIPQFSLAGGEVAPALRARADLDRYRTMLSVCRNFVVQKQGGVQNRPGTKKVMDLADPTKRGRLLPFVFSEDQSYVIVLEEGHAHLVTNGGVVESAPGTPYQFNTPWLIEDLPTLRFDQSGDTMFLAHRSYQPWQIQRLAHTNWTSGAMQLIPGTLAPSGLAHVGTTGAPAGSSEKEWDYAVTATNDLTGEESVASAIVRPSGKQPAASDPLKLDWNPVAGCTTYSVYRGKNGKLGFIGESKKLEAGKYTFTDENFVPDYSNTPPVAANPFTGVGNYPALVQFHKQRLGFASTDNYPERVWLSQIQNFRNFGASSPSQASDTVIFTPALRRVNRLRALVDSDVLVLLTVGSEHTVTGAGADAPITPAEVEVQPIGRRGGADLEPLVIDSEVVYVTGKGGAVRNLHFDFETNTKKSSDRSILAEHLFRGRTVVDWCFQQDPLSCIWAVMSDGALLGLTYVSEHDVYAWHRHDTDGTFESVCTVPEGGEDVVYVLVRRVIDGQERRFVERMASRTITDIRDAVFLDSTVTYDGRNTGATLLKFQTAGAWVVDDEVVIEADADTFVAGDVGDRVIFEGVPLTILVVSTPRLVTVRVEKDVPAEVQGVQSADWSIARKAFTSGLDHLEGKEIGILADGEEHPQVTVTGGAVALQRHASVVQFGLPYLSEIETLDLEIPQEPIGSRRKILDRAFVHVESTRGLWVGEDRENMQQHDFRTVADSFDRLQPATEVAEQVFGSSHGLPGRVVVQQRAPLPCTVLAVAPSVTVTER